MAANEGSIDIDENETKEEIQGRRARIMEKVNEICLLVRTSVDETSRSLR